MNNKKESKIEKLKLEVDKYLKDMPQEKPQKWLQYLHLHNIKDPRKHPIEKIVELWMAFEEQFYMEKSKEIKKVAKLKMKKEVKKEKDISKLRNKENKMNMNYLVEKEVAKNLYIWLVNTLDLGLIKLGTNNALVYSNADKVFVRCSCFIERASDIAILKALKELGLKMIDFHNYTHLKKTCC